MIGASRGRVVTVSDLKEVLKAKPEEKGLKGGEILSFRERPLCGASCQTRQKKKKQQKL